MLSPATRRLDLVEKRPIYAREEVPYLWLVDPADRTLEAFELHDGQWLLIASAKDDEPISIRPFDAITFSLGGSLALRGVLDRSPAGIAKQGTRESEIPHTPMVAGSRIDIPSKDKKMSEIAAIGAFLDLLADDIEAGRHVQGLPEDLAQVMLVFDSISGGAEAQI